MAGMNEWRKPEHALEYLARMHEIPHRAAGEATLLSELDPRARRVLDLGCGNGHLLSLVLQHCPLAQGVGLDLSATMLAEAAANFARLDQQPGLQLQKRVAWLKHDLDDPLPLGDRFDLVVSSFAIHHCEHERKRSLYAEIYQLLEPAGVFGNLEHVASPDDDIHGRFLAALNIEPGQEDPSNKLLDVETQLSWLREIGFQQVDCFWKWRELALLIGRKP